MIQHKGKGLLILILLLFLNICFFSNCEKDPVIAFDCDLDKSGLLCKTYQFEDQKCVGYVRYKYTENDSVLTSTYFDIDENVKKKIEYSYDSEGFLVEKKTLISESNKLEKELNSYNNGLLSQTKNYIGETLTSEIHFFYNNSGVCNRVEFLNQEGVVDSLILYEYDSMDILWRKSYFKGETALLRYEIHEWFDNSVKRIDHYNGNDVFLGYELLLFNSDGLLREQSVYNHNLVLSGKDIYEFEDKKLVKLLSYNGLMNLIAHKILIYS
ncbi:MAG: hypothetical protein PHT69_12980 [Bacteroidales bacterium]|nr:hypothetical protein [Bacteroidales bacterium]